MNLHTKTIHSACNRSTGMTLLEVIGTLGIIAVMAGMLIPVAIRILDRIARDREAAELLSLATALERGIMRLGYIPSQGDWDKFIATNAGWELGRVKNNARGGGRYLVFETGGLAANAPYVQTASGLAVAPTNARMMLISSIGEKLTPLTTFDPPDFDKLWRSTDGALPPFAIFNTFKDKFDIKIQRINLAPLFHHLVLGSYQALKSGQYKINDSAMSSVAFGNGFDGYFLQGTTVKLYSESPSNTWQHSYVLNDSRSFIYEEGTWKDSLEAAQKTGSTDAGGIVADFLAAYPNPKAMDPVSTNQQVAIVRSMITFLSNYTAWASSGKFSNAKVWSDLMSQSQKGMMNSCRGIYERSGNVGSDYSPPQISCP